MALPRPPARRRAAARVVTGPVGHLYGGMADWAAFMGRNLLSRARARAGR